MVEETHEVHVRAIVHVCDYEGRADGRSVRTLITHVEPRRVILVHGTPQDTMHLRESLEASLPGVVVDAPSNGLLNPSCDSSLARRARPLSNGFDDRAGVVSNGLLIRTRRIESNL